MHWCVATSAVSPSYFPSMPSLPLCLTVHFYSFIPRLFLAILYINALPIHLLSSSQRTFLLLSLIDKFGNLSSLLLFYINMHFISISQSVNQIIHRQLPSLWFHVLCMLNKTSRQEWSMRIESSSSILRTS